MAKDHSPTGVIVTPYTPRDTPGTPPGHAEWWGASYGAASAMGEVDVRRTTLEDV